MKIRTILFSCILVVAPIITHAQSNAERWLVNQAIFEGCEGAGGRFDTGVYRNDLDGDGRADLIIDHNGLTCFGNIRSSSFCGQLCSVDIYLRRGNLLQYTTNYLGFVENISNGIRPIITLLSRGSHGAVQWNGREFVSVR